MVEFVLTRRLEKEFASLDDAKGRRRSGMFVAEGTKCVIELLKAGLRCRYLIAKADWLDTNGEVLLQSKIETKAEADGATLRRVTRLGTTPPVIAFFNLPDAEVLPDKGCLSENLIVALDRIQDPGNLGTILRTCDWMGVRTVVASPDTVDAFNPKTVQASMGAVATVKVIYTSLEDFLRDIPVTVYGTYLDGENIYKAPLGKEGVLLMGNEGTGISKTLEPFVTCRLNIPLIGTCAHAAESLNVATATAIALSQFASRRFQ